MPHTDRHKEREIPIEFDFYNTLESLPVDNRCTIIMVSCGSAIYPDCHSSYHTVYITI